MVYVSLYKILRIYLLFIFTCVRFTCIISLGEWLELRAQIYQSGFDLEITWPYKNPLSFDLPVRASPYYKLIARPIAMIKNSLQKIPCEEKVVNVNTTEIELELQQNAANVVISRSADNQVDGFYITTPSEGEQESHQTYACNESSDKVVKQGAKEEKICKKDIKVQTMHVSCQSDTYKFHRNYAGVIIYQRNGESEWRTANNTHCKTGYIVIQDTDSKGVKQWKKEPGKVHGAVYRNAFGESVDDVEVVGEGFSIQNGILSFIRFDKFVNKSGVFNNPANSKYHDNRKTMHEVSEHCVRKIVEHWKSAGPLRVRQRNFEVKELMEDLDPSYLKKRDQKSRNQNVTISRGRRDVSSCNIVRLYRA